MNDIFKLTINNRPTRKLNENNLIKLPFNTVKFGMKSLTNLGPRIWNILPGHTKSVENLTSFKKFLKLWDGKECSCKACQKH